MAYRESITITVDQSNSGSINSQLLGTIGGFNEARRGTDIATKAVDYLTDGVYRVGHDIFGEASYDYYVDVTGLSFDLSAIPAGAIIKDVKLVLNSPFDFAGLDFTDILLIKYDWGAGSMTAGDFINLDTLSDPVAYPILGSRNSQFLFFPPSRDPSFLCNEAMVAYVQEQFNFSRPARIFMVAADTLYNKEPDFYTRERKGLPRIGAAGQDESKSYGFTFDLVTLEVTYELQSQIS